MHWWAGSVSRKGGTGGGGWGYPQGAVQMGLTRFGCEKVMVWTRWATSQPECLDRLTKNHSISPCRGLISSREGCLGSKIMFESADSSMLVN